MRFCWTTLHVSDMERSLSFYREIIGLTLNRRVKLNEEMELAFLGEGETQIELAHDINTTAVDLGEDISLGFFVDSVDRFTEHLQSKGVRIHSGPFQPTPSVRFIYVQDPDGLKIQLIESVSSE